EERRGHVDAGHAEAARDELARDPPVAAGHVEHAPSRGEDAREEVDLGLRVLGSLGDGMHVEPEAVEEGLPPLHGGMVAYVTADAPSARRPSSPEGYVTSEAHGTTTGTGISIVRGVGPSMRRISTVTKVSPDAAFASTSTSISIVFAPFTGPFI